MTARALSKSKIMAFRQCPKRLWLEVHHPELREDSAEAETWFAEGDRVGEIARQLYDPKNKGKLVDREGASFNAAFARTQALLQTRQPIFEGGFRVDGALVFTDVMLPVDSGGKSGWRLIEVKASTSVKDCHRDDVAVQACVTRATGLPLTRVALACIDNAWVYPGGDDYAGLLREEDLSKEAFGRTREVESWIEDAQRVVARVKEPPITTGDQCEEPYECPFLQHCKSQEPQAEYPVEWLPGRWSAALQTHVEESGAIDLAKVPDELLSARQQRVKAVTVSGRAYFDREAATRVVAAHKLPAYFMDFETVQFAVPIWKGTGPYQQIPFQFSLHRLDRKGKLDHRAFLDLTGADPRKAFAEALLAACGERGPVFVYNAAFEKTRIHELAASFPRLAASLLAINERVVDLLPIARNHYYHPGQHGSWSIKAVLPAICPDLSYGDLDGVQDGGMAVEAFKEALQPSTTNARKRQIERQLLEYCQLDTLALIRLWSAFSGQSVAC